VLGAFAFAFRAPPPAVVPARVLSRGGPVSITLYEPARPPVLGCAIAFGGAAGVLSALSSPAAGQYTLQALAPPGDAPAAPIELACPRGALRGPWEPTGAYLGYLAAPRAEHWAPRECALGQVGPASGAWRRPRAAVRLPRPLRAAGVVGGAGGAGAGAVC